MLLEVSWEKAWADEIHSLVIRLLTNMLYKLPDASKASRSSKPIFDIEQLDILGGMECICVEVEQLAPFKPFLEFYAFITRVKADTGCNVLFLRSVYLMVLL